MGQTTRHIRVEASNPQQLQARLPNLTLLPGSTGRLEIRAHRVFGACPIPLGPLMAAPWVGDLWANHLSPAGATMTGRGALGVCDAFVDWAIPAPMGRIAALSLGPVALVALGVAITGALALLAWSISRLVLSIVALVEEAPVVAAGLGIALAAGVALLALGAIRGRS